MKQEPLILTVSALTRRVRNLLESGIGEVWVEGEISNLRRQNSGHIYFTLKDSSAQLACVLFASQATQIRNLKIADGGQVQIFGQVTVYESRGQYQLIVRNVQPRGAGVLQAKFEELKERLSAEGLFDACRKRPLPLFPQCVGVVTSPTGAAIRDFLHVLHRRQPGIHVIIYPVRVQGRGAAEEIAQAVRHLGSPTSIGIPAIDVIVVTRGGGSLEDLWEFNEEVVARAIVASPIPVVSAVGHEIDFTISDFAADERAPTPSAAAEILSANSVELLERIDQLARNLRRYLRSRLESARERLEHIRRSALFLLPLRSLRELQQTLDRSREDLDHVSLEQIHKQRRQLEYALAAINVHNPGRKLAEASAILHRAWHRMEHAVHFSIEKTRGQLDKSSALLCALNPQAALARGYTLTMSEEGRVISKAAEVQEEDILVTHFRDGTVRSVVQSSTTS